MSTTNGSSVTRAELAAHIKGIDQRFANVESDIIEIKYGIQGIRDHVLQESWLGPRGREFVVGAGFVSAVAAVLIAVFLH